MRLETRIARLDDEIAEARARLELLRGAASRELVYQRPGLVLDAEHHLDELVKERTILEQSLKVSHGS